MAWDRGLNFNQFKYQIISKTSFIPHLRSNSFVSIPRSILENFGLSSKNVALVNIRDTKKNLEFLRIKKLHRQGNSYLISFKAEKSIKNPLINVRDIKSENQVLARKTQDDYSLLNFISRSTTKNTPIYVFNYKSSLVVGGYYKKDLLIKKRIIFNKFVSSVLGLYLAEGGKVNTSFTNSWPDAVNVVLDFIERLFNIKRDKVKAVIYCNSKLENKQRQLEKFWSVNTGVSNFSKNLHLSKNSKAPQGTLELYFCSEIIKDIFLNLMSNFSNYSFDRIAFLRGFLSGDGSPIQQTKYSLTHHITFDQKDYQFYKKLFNQSFLDLNFRIKQKKIVLYPSWEMNKFLLLKDIYGFNLLNRFRFAKRFLNLPKTRELIKDDRKLKRFKKRYYPRLSLEFIKFYHNLRKFRIDEELIKNRFYKM